MKYPMCKKLGFDKNIKFKPHPESNVYLVSENGDIVSTWSNGRVIKPQTNKVGYLYVSLSIKNKPKNYRVNRLVATVFNGPPPSKNHHACHLDGNIKNNHYKNISWGTAKENCSHKRIHGTSQSGERNPFCKLQDSQIKQIRQEYKDGLKAMDLARKYNLAYSYVYQLLSNKMRNTPNAQPSGRVEKSFDFISLAKGISFDKRLKKWTAQARVNKKKKHIGVFKTAEEAAQAYKKFIEFNSKELG